MEKMSTTKSAKELPKAVIGQMLTLATSGFGIVAALAWNEVVKSFVDEYVRKYLGENSGIISLLIYAVIVTVLAVVVTLQLTKIQEKFNPEKQEKKTRSK